MKITCKSCKGEVNVPMLFYGERIVTQQFILSDAMEYKAVVQGKALCLCCGAVICETFSSVIKGRDIVRLAIGEGGEE
jgi:hypothetical protein